MDTDRLTTRKRCDVIVMAGWLLSGHFSWAWTIARARVVGALTMSANRRPSDAGSPWKNQVVKELRTTGSEPIDLARLSHQAVGAAATLGGAHARGCVDRVVSGIED